MYTETYDLEFQSPGATRYFLLIIAQEEAAKAFLLYLINAEIAPLTSGIRRAINDHACKHLVGMIMDYMIRHWEGIDELKAIIERDIELGDSLPSEVASALEILRYEKIGRWTDNNWVWAEEPDYDQEALKIADGRRDRRKQDALYVRIGSNGQLASTPEVITDREVATELERTRRYLHFVEALLEPAEQNRFDAERFVKVIAALKLLFKSDASKIA